MDGPPYSLNLDPADPRAAMSDQDVESKHALDRAPGEGDTCRICRSEGTSTEPLFYPCKCSGSIKFVHQECLMEWLSHSNKKYCELCKTPFRFTKLYDSHMPHTLPLHIFLRKAALHTLRYVLTWVRGLAVAIVWLLVLPWCIRWSWRGLFWLLDAGWARDAWLAKEGIRAHQASPAPSLADSLADAMNQTLTAASTAPTANHSAQPIGLNLSKLLVSALLNPWRPFSTYRGIENFDPISRLTNAATSTLLSDVKSLNSLTTSASLNRFILDVLEGQIVTLFVVIAFILVFLIREWVVQQQPIINAAAQLRDAEMQVEVVDQAARQLRARLEPPNLGDARMVNHHVQDLVRLDDDTRDDDGDNTNVDEADEDNDGHVDENVDENTDDNVGEVASDHGRSQVGDFEAEQATNTAPLPGQIVEHPISGMDATEELHPEPPSPISRPGLSSRDSSAYMNQVLQALGENETNGSFENIDYINDRDSPQDMTLPGAGDGTTAGSSTLVSRSSEQKDLIGEQHSRPEETPKDVAAVQDDSPVSPKIDDSLEIPGYTEDDADQGSHSVLPQDDIADAGPDLGPFDESLPESVLLDVGQSAAVGPAHLDDNSVRESEVVQAQATGLAQQDNSTLDVPPANVLQRMFNWFWNDIVPEAEDAPMELFDEAIVQDVAEEAPFVRVPGGGAQPEDAPRDELAAQDPEVLQAAADAGLDADALEDVEDLEGILELIGMQGPLVGLLQTAMFCGVLITTTLWAALGTPYLFGKLALLFLGDPLVFLIMAPLRGVSLIADVIVDCTIYAGGLLFYLAARALSQASVWPIKLLSLNVQANSFDLLANSAHGAIKAAGARLSNIAGGDGPLEAGLLQMSLHAHRSLQTLQIETAQVTALVVRLITSASTHLKNASTSQALLTVAKSLGRELSQAKDYFIWARGYLQSSFGTSINNGTITLTLTRDTTQLDPALAYWTSADRCLTILTGYVFLAMIGTMYLLRKEPLFTSASLQKIEKGFTDFLKQAGGVLKVILIISIEMLMFPLYCGLLLDCALLPLFGNASIGSRLLFAIRSPWMFAFVHWFIGTCYMFHFALFVSACRRVMRKGVLYFIRDPDDPTFHPVRDVLERNVTTQLRKIAFSALVYGGLVICCLGGVVWGVDKVFPSVFPVRWATPEPLLEFPIDFLIYNLLAPIVARFLLPSQGLEDLFKIWLRFCARMLRLSDFLFGDRQKDEEGHHVRIRRSDGLSDNGYTEKTEFIKDGRYVRAPASDQVRIPKGDRVFLEVTDDNKRVDGQLDSRTGPHGRKNNNFTKVYIPPRFQLRIAFFIFGLWFFAAATGLGITVVPTVSGRLLLSITMPERVDFNDLYAFSVGLITLGGAVYVVARSRDGYRSFKTNVSKDVGRNILRSTNTHLLRAFRSIYVYGFALVVVPTLFALVLQLYLILPLHTYTSSWSSGSNNVGESSTNTTNAIVSAIPVSQTMPGSLVVRGHTIHILQDWTLGYLYGRIVFRLLMLSRNSRPATALRLITRDGYTNPNVKLATRAFVAPTVLLFSIILLCPPIVALATNSLLRLVTFPGETIPQALSIKVYRYSYPVCASQVLVLWCMWEVVKATKRWRHTIKDEVYLIGERLHNFGERRPPEGSRSGVRT